MSTSSKNGEKKNCNTTLHMSGVKINLPVKPYQSQIQMMSKVITGLKRQQHCLLESPTGSGKSLALLCSALAWQKAEKSSILSNNNAPNDKGCGEYEQNNDTKFGECKCKKPVEAITTLFETEPGQIKPTNSLIDLTCDSEDDDFQQSTYSTKKKTKKKKQRKTDDGKNVPSLAEELDKVTAQQELCSSCVAKKNAIVDADLTECKSKPQKVPKIWYGTRTHKQITQIVHELARTDYKDVPMTILSSREHSCIHPMNEKSKNKTEECKDWRNGTHSEMPGVRCIFHQNVNRLRSHEHLYSCGLTKAWDIEDLVGLGREVKACPYYSAKELINTAEIVFCPYNYIIDPAIRGIMSINTKDQVIILDEAHNVEDSAREAASFSLPETDLANATADISQLISQEIKLDDHRPLYLLCTRVGQWLQFHCGSLKETEYESSSTVWSGNDFLTHLAEWGITQDTLPMLLKNFASAKETEDSSQPFLPEQEKPPTMHSSSQAVLGGLFQVLEYLMLDGNKYCEDYRITIIKQSKYGIEPPRRTGDGWVSVSKRPRKYFVITLNFWCQNPAVAFGALANAHSVILTSGTLSPMSSFASELGTEFPVQLEANHVINDSQVWVGCLGQGPSNVKLQATYKQSENFHFQDELGEVIRRVCGTVPNGILCFFSSYSFLNKLMDRWEGTGLLDRVKEYKYVVSEPRVKGKASFESMLVEFYDNVNGNDAQQTGALMLAVCRGKISEGLDFADSNARAVITVGIPFPNFMDKQVKLKRAYNDKHRMAKGLLSGSEWYDIQAFRAMNQALGRCIRHKNDWGALLIIDDRFVKNPTKYCKGLSKWVRNKAKSHFDFNNAISSLNTFILRQTMPRDEDDHLLEEEESVLHDANVQQSFFTNTGVKRKQSQDETMHQSKTMVLDVTCEGDDKENETAFYPDSICQQPPIENKPGTTFDKFCKKSNRKMMNNSYVVSTDRDSCFTVKSQDPSKLNDATATNDSSEAVACVSNANKETKPNSRSIKIYKFKQDNIKHHEETSMINCTNNENKNDIKSVVNNPQIVENSPFLHAESPVKNPEKLLEIPESPCGDNMTIYSHDDEVPAKKNLFTVETKEAKKDFVAENELPLLQTVQVESPVVRISLRRKMKKKKGEKESSTSATKIYCRNCKLIFNTGSISTCPPGKIKFRSEFLKRHLVAEDSMFELEYTKYSNQYDELNIKRNADGILLNAVWSEEDNQCYQTYKCSKCSNIAAIRISTNPSLRRKILLLD